MRRVPWPPAGEGSSQRSGAVWLQRRLPPLTRVCLWASQRSAGVWPVDLGSRPRSATCPGGHPRATAVHRASRRTVADGPIVGTQAWHPILQCAPKPTYPMTPIPGRASAIMVLIA